MKPVKRSVRPKQKADYGKKANKRVARAQKVRHQRKRTLLTRLFEQPATSDNATTSRLLSEPCPKVSKTGMWLKFL